MGVIGVLVSFFPSEVGGRARLYQMIVRSVFTVSCPSCGALLAFTETLASRSDEPRADSLDISRFLPSFLGKMAVFDKTDSLPQPMIRCTITAIVIC